MWFPQLGHFYAFPGVRGRGDLLRLALFRASSPRIFFPDGVVQSMANDVRVCQVHGDDDCVRPGVFQLEQAALFCGAEEGGERLERGVLDVDGRGGCARGGACREDVRCVEGRCGYREGGLWKVSESRPESLQERDSEASGYLWESPR